MSVCGDSLADVGRGVDAFRPGEFIRSRARNGEVPHGGPAEDALRSRATLDATEPEMRRRWGAVVVVLMTASGNRVAALHPRADGGPLRAGVAVPQPRGSATGGIAETIDSFGFDTRAAVGIGGFVTTRVYPVVLFRNGDALTDVEGLGFPGGLEAHRRAHPRDWTRWRRGPTRIQLETAKGWKNLAFPTTYGTLPEGFLLEGLYRNLAGTGTMGVGGTDAVTVWDQYTFSRDGRVVRGGGAGAQAEAGTTTTTSSAVAANRHGRYRVEGLTLRITWDDGTAEARILVTDPSDPRGAIWLDGTGYVRRAR